MSLNATCTPPQPLGDLAGHFHVEAAQDRRIARVGLDERRASLGVAAPAQHAIVGARLQRNQRAYNRRRLHEAERRVHPA
jgi:hypothetical protein